MQLGIIRRINNFQRLTAEWESLKTVLSVKIAIFLNILNSRKIK